MNFKDTYWNSDAAVNFFNADNPERRIIQPKIADEVIACQPKKFLDYGCGDGYLASLLPNEIEIDLFDKNQNVLCDTLNKLNKRNCQGIHEDSIIKDDYYDCITLNFVLVCIDTEEEQQRIINLLRKALKKGGTLIITNSHPCFLQYKNTSFHTSFKPKCFEYLNNGEAYTVSIHQEIQQSSLSFVDYKWTLSFWIKLAYTCGLRLVKMTEVKDDNYLDFEPNNLYPPFLILKYIK